MAYYHIEPEYLHSMKKLPDRILVREDGYLGAYKYDGVPIVDYWYVPERTCKIHPHIFVPGRMMSIKNLIKIFECKSCGKMFDYALYGPFKYCPHCGGKIIDDDGSY